MEAAKEWVSTTAKSELAASLSLELANRLKDPARVKQIVTAPGNISMLGGHPWDDVALSAGYPGTILLFTEWDRQAPDEGWDIVAHSHLLALQEGLRQNGCSNISMFCGLSGAAFAVMSASRKGTRYTEFMAELNERIADGALDMVKDFKRSFDTEKGVSPKVYDVIMGLTGTGRYLLEWKHNDKAASALSAILEYLVELTYPIEVNGCTVPGWYVPQKYQFSDQDKMSFPNGSFNCGLAHGIPGPLVLMSLALQKGVEVKEQRTAMRRIAQWLIYHAAMGEHGHFWPSVISFEQETAQEGEELQRTRDAWCYGSAGVARSLFLAGRALGDELFCRWGVRGFDSIFARPEEQWRLDGPTFCHGHCGLMQMTLRMAQDTGEERFKGYVDRLLDIVLRYYEPDSPLGFRDLEVTQGIEKAGLLDGTPGVALTLLSLSLRTEPTWDYPFLIA
ncbi:lanthionine synthetase C family protein [Paenibacillus ehimensis]|uniref:lanthionine synthetase C family protein n=1 Tax=Paenibacillus ehimensis TaxID=79264 RepID=UPI002DB96547|nr:lanthionine synthetase C family protein [Paenibacillus ehimensis]MEC0210463.1 lanthionine synthetase C family protein [Paenibacillus ehimensis]